MKKILVSLFSIVLFLIGSVAKAESFYVQLDISEQKIGTAIKFSLNKASALYGEYDNFLNKYNESNSGGNNYILETYDSKKGLQGKYEFKSSRFVFWDGENTGGVEENDSGIINAIIPYDRNEPTAFIIINNKGVKTDYIALPVAQLEEEFEKIPLCKKENEKVDLNNNKCCSGFIPAPQEDNSYVCVNCGDGKCSKYETYNTCYKDCPMQAPSQEQTGKNIGLFLSIIGALAAVGLIAAAIIIIARSRRN